MSLHTVALFGAFWTVLVRCRPFAEASTLRCVVALAAGAVAAHLGWALLHPLEVRLQPLRVLEPSVGLCVLFLPAGVALATRAPSVWRVLPGGLAVARLGCLAAGCCGGLHGEATPALEIAGLAILDRELQRAGPRWSLPGFLIGFGAIRLAVEPWRGPPPLPGSYEVAGWIALGWAALGGVLAFQAEWRSAPTPASPCMGRRTQKVAPSPSLLCTSRVPPWSVTMR